MESQIKKRLEDAYKIQQLESELSRTKTELYKTREFAGRYSKCFLDAVDDISEFMQEQFANSDYKYHIHFCEDYCPFKRCKWNCFEGYEDDSADYYAELREDEIYSKRKERGDYSSA